MIYSTLLLDRSSYPSVAILTLNRPDKRNALNPTLISEITHAFTALAHDDSIKVIILAANGKAFCAGMDLAYLQEISRNSVMQNKADSRRFHDMLSAIYTCPKPVIARVQGAAIAGGCGIASVCDIVVASREKALFGYSEVKIGFIPAIVSVYLVRRIGGTHAQRLLLTAENVSADEAHRLGFVTYVADDAALDTTVMNTAQMLTANSSSAMALTKEILGNLSGMSLHAALDYACSMNAIARTTEDFQRGIASFLEKH
ncbi:MAG: enoyl-CoA hydratase-related protein [Bacteroidota bacterium]|nr:enoyl-CoA hydratase-related protein [Candidatus Kapabacteria bacterium]MDW8219100.1 enoyl-CoA hydratase-related protein [Bacteroidota bacterium]